MKKIFATFLIFFIFFLMLAFPSITKNAAHQGLNLWIFTVMPALLPYTIVSSILLYINAFSLPCSFIKKLLHIRIPENHVFTCICGLLCGCPIGAKVAADNYSACKLSKSSAEYLMCAFNCISPSFLINYVFVEVYSPYISLTLTHMWLIFGILLISSVLGATVCALLPRKKDITVPLTQQHSCVRRKQSFSTLIDNCILSAFEIQVKIGGYIILFTIIIQLLLHTLNLSPLAASILGSILEITSGLGTFTSQQIDVTSNLHKLIPCIITSLTSFGGICTIFQTKTVISCTDLSISRYALSKLISAIISFLLTYLLL